MVIHVYQLKKRTKKKQNHYIYYIHIIPIAKILIQIILLCV
jgi:hypothetical protein